MKGITSESVEGLRSDGYELLETTSRRVLRAYDRMKAVAEDHGLQTTPLRGLPALQAINAMLEATGSPSTSPNAPRKLGAILRAALRAGGPVRALIQEGKHVYAVLDNEANGRTTR